MNNRTARIAEHEPGRSRLLSVPRELGALIDQQCGVVTRAQLHAAGFSKENVRAGVAARRWQLVGRRVVVLHNDALSAEQQRWAAVLLPGKPAALAGLTAASEAGLVGFEDPQVHVVVAEDTNARYPAWVTVHNSRRFARADVARHGGVRRTTPARSVVDAAAWQPFPRRAAALLCAAVQQRVTSAWALDRALTAAGSVRHVAVMRDVIGDIDGGAHTLDELDLGPLAKRAGLAPPRRQVVRHQPGGRKRYVDAEFDLPDGQLLVVEIDGAVHLRPQTWWDDMARQNELVIGGSPVLRFSSVDVRLEPDRVVDQLRRVGHAHQK
jgi:Protein of unknown function (DUF559)